MGSRDFPFGLSLTHPTLCVCGSGFEENENCPGTHLQSNGREGRNVGHVDISSPVGSVESIDRFGIIEVFVYFAVGVQEGIGGGKNS